MDGSSSDTADALHAPPTLQTGASQPPEPTSGIRRESQSFKEEQWQITMAPTPSYPSCARTAC